MVGIRSHKTEKDPSTFETTKVLLIPSSEALTKQNRLREHKEIDFRLLTSDVFGKIR